MSEDKLTNMEMGQVVANLAERFRDDNSTVAAVLFGVAAVIGSGNEIMYNHYIRPFLDELEKLIAQS